MTTVSGAVDRLIAGLGELGAETAVLAATARTLAGRIDSGEVPGYSLAAASRELRAVVAALCGHEAMGGGLSDAEFERLVSGSW